MAGAAEIVDFNSKDSITTDNDSLDDDSIVDNQNKEKKGYFKTRPKKLKKDFEKK